MSFIKQTAKNTASLLVAIGIIGSAYAALTTVNSGDPLTASSWNEVINKLTNLDTNSGDLVTKSYVDTQISANSGGGASRTDIQTILLANGTATQTSSYWRGGNTLSKSNWVNFTDLIEVNIATQCGSSPSYPSCSSGYTLYQNVSASANDACNSSTQDMRYSGVICYKTNP